MEEASIAKGQTLTMSNVVETCNNAAQQGSAIKFENPFNDPSTLTFNNVTIKIIL